ncbi:unnamed protein product, partial [Mesorhabditis belari]|uniref:EGF-like domain-containing protein n=1 Tax=Mesorhabditis belari TaxID=2138241 RepID=A0AAF3EG58_9BILA
MINNYVCLCYPGLSGNYCNETDTTSGDPCSSSPCQRGCHILGASSVTVLAMCFTVKPYRIAIKRGFHSTIPPTKRSKICFCQRVCNDENTIGRATLITVISFLHNQSFATSRG